MLQSQLEEKNYSVVIAEVEDAFAATRRIMTAYKLYDQSKAACMVLSAHGSKDSSQFNSKSDTGISKEDFGPKYLQQIGKLKSKYFEEKFPWLFNSCSTGKNDGLVEAIAGRYDGMVVGPDEPGYIENLDVVFDDENKIIGFVPEYKSDGTEVQGNAYGAESSLAKVRQFRQRLSGIFLKSTG